MAIGIGCDIGGTFTDLLMIDEENGQAYVDKVLTTPHDPSAAIETGLENLDRMRPGAISEALMLVHGTTLVINAVIERKGARTGLITTRGFRDVLEIAREKRYDGGDLQIRFPEPLVARPLRVEVQERVHTSGRVLTELDEASVVAALTALQAQAVESIAVCLINSFANPAHEQRIGEIARRVAPGITITLSHEVLRELREYERSTTTVVNAYTKPATARYLERLDGRLRDIGFAGELLLMQSSGGLNSSEMAKRFPVQILESGPAAGMIGAAHYARLAGYDKVLAFDMGGTTAKMCLVMNGRVGRVNELEVDRVHRFKRGSGIPVRVSVVDLIEIGAGGGSIAKRTAVGTLQVGPESSSAVPGPACYGQGGTEPTVSDADLVLGYLDGDSFLGGRMKLDRAAAERAIKRVLADPLGISVVEAAFGIHAIVNENMASAAKAYVSEKGENPKSCALVGFGGAGPVHSCDLAARLGIDTVLIPPRAGVAAAFGMIVAPVAYDAVRSHRVLFGRVTAEELGVLHREMAAECETRLPKTVNTAEVTHEFSVDMRYLGQGYDVNVVFSPGSTHEETLAAIRNGFERAYLKLYGRIYPDLALELMTFRLSASAQRKVAVMDGVRSTASTDGKTGTRQAYCPRLRTWMPFSVHRRDRIAVGMVLPGPAIIEEDESTTVVPSGATLFIDEHGSLIVKLARTPEHVQQAGK